MTKLILILLPIVLTYASSQAATNLTSTDLSVTVPPTVAQLETARSILKEAIHAQKSGNKKLLNEKLEKALRYQKSYEKMKTFKAAFVLSDRANKQNYFANENNRYDYNIEDTCFVGTPTEALELLKAAIEESHIGSDEDWYEEAEAPGRFVEVIAVNGPNKTREVVIIKPCR